MSNAPQLTHESSFTFNNHLVLVIMVTYANGQTTHYHVASCLWATLHSLVSRGCRKHLGAAWAHLVAPTSKRGWLQRGLVLAMWHQPFQPLN